MDIVIIVRETYLINTRLIIKKTIMIIKNNYFLEQFFVYNNINQVKIPRNFISIVLERTVTNVGECS